MSTLRAYSSSLPAGMSKWIFRKALVYLSKTAGTPSSYIRWMSSSQLMSSPGVAATRSTSSTSDRSNWYGNVRPVSSSVSMPIFTDSRDPAPPPAAPVARSSSIARSARVVKDLLLQERLDLGQRPLLGLPRDVVGPGQRDLGHGRGLDGQRAQVLWLEAVHVCLAARPREHLRLERERVQEVVDALGGLVDPKALAQFRVLRGDADRAAAGVAVVAPPGPDAHPALVVRDSGDLLVAVERHQRRMADRHRLGAERQALGDVGAVADAAGHDQVYLVDQPDILERPAGFRDRGHQRDAGLLRRDVRPGPGAALGAVEVDGVGPALGGHPDVVVDPRRAELELDRHLVVGRLADLLDLQRQVVRPQPLRMTRRAAPVDPGGPRAHP